MANEDEAPSRAIRVGHTARVRGGGHTAGDLRGFLLEHLPEHLRPSASQVVSEMPLAGADDTAAHDGEPPAWSAVD